MARSPRCVPTTTPTPRTAAATCSASTTPGAATRRSSARLRRSARPRADLVDHGPGRGGVGAQLVAALLEPRHGLLEAALVPDVHLAHELPHLVAFKAVRFDERAQVVIHRDRIL